MGFIRKLGKKIAGGIRSLGRKIKKGFKSLARGLGKFGPLGTIALSFILPGLGSTLATWIPAPIKDFFSAIVKPIRQAGSLIKEGTGMVFNRVTDAIEYGVNAVSRGRTGTDFRNFVSEITGGFIKESTVPVKDAAEKLGLNPEDVLKAIDDGLTTADEVRKQAFPELFEETTKNVVESGKPSLLEGKGENQSWKDYIGESKEYDVGKKLSAIQKAGGVMLEEDDAIANYNAQQLQYQKDYYSNIADDILNTSYNPSKTLGSTGPVGFIDLNSISRSSNPYDMWLENIYNMDKKILSIMPLQEKLQLAHSSNNYGFSFEDLGGN